MAARGVAAGPVLARPVCGWVRPPDWCLAADASGVSAGKHAGGYPYLLHRRWRQILTTLPVSR